VVKIPTTSSNADIKKALRQAKRRLKLFTNEISATSKVINKQVAEEVENEIRVNYDNFVNSLPHDHQDRSDTMINSYQTDRGCVVFARGSQVLYDEFGTGDMGMLFPHPDKSKYSLKPYNSGKHIKLSKDGSHYWVYYSDKDGQFVTSSGVPAGMFMYKSFENIASGIAADIMFKEYLKTCKKYNER